MLVAGGAGLVVPARGVRRSDASCTLVLLSILFISFGCSALGSGRRKT